MDRQAKFKAQTYNPRFADGSADRLPVKILLYGVLPWILLMCFSIEPKFDSDAFKTGKSADDEWLAKVPEEVGYTGLSTLREGKEKYDIHCSVCHGDYGNGQGLLRSLGNLHEIFPIHPIRALIWNLLPWTDGQLYNAISNGSGSGIMLGLKDRLSPKERWSIVMYLRALQNYVGTATK